MEFIHGIVNSINNVLWSYVLIVILIGLGLWFTVSTNFVQVRMLPEMLRVLTTGTSTKPKSKEVSTFQAFCISAASRVGVGNIAGVAIAIALGGPGAVFWMWVIALIGAATGFIESTLAQIYKIPKADGLFHGGPAYYIENGLGQPKVARLFAVLLTVTFGLIYNSVQANTIADAFHNSFAIPQETTGLVLALAVGIIIFGGVNRVASIAGYLLPFMAGLYLFIALAVILLHIDRVPAMFALIFHDAFQPQAAVSGGLIAVILTGVKRGLFSNEAGEGSVPNAAATAATSHPVKQGLVQSFGVFVDTWLVCSATAFIILLSGQYTVGGELTGVKLAQASLAANFGDIASTLLAFLIFLFAFSSLISNYTYGEINQSHFGSHPKLAIVIYRLCVVGMVFFGCIAKLSFVWDMADLFMGFLCMTNLYAISRLAKYAIAALGDYLGQKAAGIKEPEFDPNILPDEHSIYAWQKENKL
ncbi:alanine/glycine:cation symporter family protein [Selenomonas sp. TAMA-11512]|uniref:alanine/glycine:cation symporter family protein n=1 Tax=Selenomonas sp. TAMA-11512 TaxID=3095337 RepID=UPI0030907B26|nr:alanine/glycine:cation symporter family protein [Selenomonas sp. TAMA-11512]